MPVLLFIEGSLVVLSVCRAHHRLSSDARTAHFRRFHAAASSITARQENHAQRHRNRGSGTSSQLRLDPVRNDRSDDSRRPSNLWSPYGIGRPYIFSCCGLLWPPYVIGGPLYFCPVVSFLLSFFFFLA